MSNHRWLLLPFPLALIASPTFAGDPAGHQADLTFGPLLSGRPIVYDLRTHVANAPVIAFLGFGGGATVPLDSTLPVLHVTPAASFVFLQTDATGRVRIELPTAAGQFPAGSGLDLFTQAVLALPGGKFASSEARAAAIEPSAPAPGHFTELAATELPAGYDQLNASQVDVLDFDRDGRRDLLMAAGADLRVWRNLGSAGFVDATAGVIAHPGDAVSALRVADLDLDGDHEILTGGGYDSSSSVSDRLWSLQAGSFVQVAGFPAGDGLTSRFEVADLDGDGSLDLLLAAGKEAHVGTPGGKFKLYRGDGALGFANDAAFEAAAWNDDVVQHPSIRCGDIDNDGDLDVLACKSDSGSLQGGPGEPNALLLNLGSASFVDVATSRFSTLFSDNTQDAAFTDLDSDGDLDLVCANSVFSVTAANSGDVWINQGGAQGISLGFFLEDAGSPLEISSPLDATRLAIEASDLDKDGDPELVLGVHDLFLGSRQILLVNQGNAQGGVAGALQRAMWFDPGDFICYGLATLDLEDDGDVDLVMTASGVVGGDPAQGSRVRVLRNTQP
jgi:FG-GAP-like repeat